MVRQWQTLFYDHHYSATNLHDGDGKARTTDDGRGRVLRLPDFVKLAEAYGCVGIARVHQRAGRRVHPQGERDQRPSGAHRLPRVEGCDGVADGRRRRVQQQRGLHARHPAAAPG
ncbi:MAG: thiamine pyrophosphate-dependent enzyme [Bifidobacterium pullorum]